MAELGVLLISGRLTHQENYAALFRADSRCRLVGLSDEVDVSPERARWNQELAADLGIPYLPNLDEALAIEDVDLVSVCAEPERRGRVLLRCAQAGKHLYIDKPMTPYLSIASAIANTVEAAGLRSQMFSFVHQPWAQRARQVIESGQLGDLLALHADCLFAKGPAGTATDVQAAPTPQQFTFVDAKAELYALGVYSLGLVCWLTGLRVKTVFGHTANYFFEAHQRVGVEDFGLLGLTFEGGLAATISGGRVGWSSHGGAGTNQIALIGTKGTLLVDAYRPRLEVYDTVPPWTPPAVNPLDPMGFWRSTQAEVDTQPKRVFAPLPEQLPAKSDAAHFIDCILEDHESDMNARQAATLTEILLAGYRAAETGAVVSLPLAED